MTIQWRKIDGVNEPTVIEKMPRGTQVLVGYHDPTIGKFGWNRGTYYKDKPDEYGFFQGDGMGGSWVFTHFMEIEPPESEKQAT